MPTKPQRIGVYRRDLIKNGELSFEEVRAMYAAKRTAKRDQYLMQDMESEKTKLQRELQQLRKTVNELRTQRSTLEHEVQHLSAKKGQLSSSFGAAPMEDSTDPTQTFGFERMIIRDMINNGVEDEEQGEIEIARGRLGAGGPSIFEDAFQSDSGFVIHEDTGIYNKKAAKRFIPEDDSMQDTHRSGYCEEPEEEYDDDDDDDAFPRERYSPAEWNYCRQKATASLSGHPGIFSGSSTQVPKPSQELLVLGDWELQMDAQIGGQTEENGVYKVERVDNFDIEDTEYVVKFYPPKEAEWDWYMYQVIQERVHDMRSHFVKYRALHQYPGRSLIVMDYVEHKDLEAATRLYLRDKEHMDETLIIYYTIELLKIVHALHSSGVVHGNIKPSHVLIRNLNSDKTHLWENWGPGDVPGWDLLGLYLIDFSRATDLAMYPNGDDTAFVGCPPNTESSELCPEMKAGRPWNKQPDYWGIATVVYYMLTGTPLMTTKDSSGRLKPSALGCSRTKGLQFPDVWSELFDSFLNIKDCSSLPSLYVEQRRLENFLTANPALAHSVRTLLVKQNIKFYES